MNDELHFRAMGSDAHVVVVGGDAALADAARRRLFGIEQRWSRFVPGSEVSMLNRFAGELVPVSWETVLLVRCAVDAWRITGGSFDATVLGDLQRAGYDRSFESLVPSAATSDLITGCTDIEVSDDAVRLPRGTGFDPGGIGKGLAADLVAGEVMAAGADGVCINLGGDLRVLGRAPFEGAWTVGIEDPLTDTTIATVGLEHGAVATSTTVKRRWMIEGEHRHHLIDPATGQPSASDIVLATVIAGEAWMAEVLAKAVLLRGSNRAFDLLDEYTTALVVDSTGTITRSVGFDVFAGVAA